MARMHEIMLYIQEWILYQWRDGVEILLLAGAFFVIIHWLTKDKSQMLEYFYLYWALFFISYFAELETMSRLLLITTPIVAMLFILLHQTTLQQHFITLKKSHQPVHDDWISILIQTTLIAMNRNKSFMCIIECTQSMGDFLHAPPIIDAKLSEPFLTAVIESPHFNEHQFIWCNQKGKLLSFNASWITKDYQPWLSEELQQEHRWKQEALFFAHKADFILFKLNPSQRSYDVVINAGIAENINAPQLTQLLYGACATARAHQKHIIDQKERHGISFRKPSQEHLHQ